MNKTILVLFTSIIFTCRIGSPVYCVSGVGDVRLLVNLDLMWFYELFKFRNAASYSIA